MKASSCFDAVALVGVGGFDLRAAFGLLLFELRVAAGIEPDLLVPDFDDLRDGDVEEDSGRAR